MSKTKINHYIPQFLIKYFKEPNKPLYELDCATLNIVEKSTKTLFSQRKIWGQDLENTINRYEDKVSRIIAKLHNMPLNNTDTHYYVDSIVDSEERALLASMLTQSMLLQKFNGSQYEENIIKDLYSQPLKNTLSVIYIRANTIISSRTPYILIDNLVFIDIILSENQRESLGNVCFAYPISPYEIICIGINNPNDFNKFLNNSLLLIF